MDSYPLYITVLSAKGLKNVASSFSKMNVYVIVSVDGYPKTAVKSSIHKDAGSNPRWNHTNKFRFNLDKLTVEHNSLKFKLKCNRFLGDKNIGEVAVPISDLFRTVSENDNAAEILAKERVVEYKVRTTSGKLKGCLKFAYKFGEKYTKRQFSPPPPDASKVYSDLNKREKCYQARSRTELQKKKKGGRTG